MGEEKNPPRFSSDSSLLSELSRPIAIMPTEDDKSVLIESRDSQVSESSAGQDDPILGFFFLGFVANMSFDYLLQEAKLFSEIFDPSYSGHAPAYHSGATLLGQFIMLFFGTSRYYTARIASGLAILGVTMLVLAILIYVNTAHRIAFLYLDIFVMGLTTAVVNGSGFALIGYCSERVRLFYSVGSCLGGAMAWVSMQISTFAIVKALGVASTRIKKEEPSKAEILNCFCVIASAFVFFLLAAIYYLFKLSRSPAVIAAERKAMEAQQGDKSDSDSTTGKSLFWETAVTASPLCLAIGNIIFTSFMIHPDQAVHWTAHQVHFKSSPTFFQDFAVFAFNGFDLVGRLLTTFAIRLDHSHVFSGSFLRWILILFYLLAAAEFWVFENDFVKLALQASFGLSYGILLTWAYTLAPTQKGLKPGSEGTVGVITSFVAVGALLLGSMFSGVVSAAIKQMFNFRPYEVVNINGGNSDLGSDMVGFVDRTPPS